MECCSHHWSAVIATPQSEYTHMIFGHKKKTNESLRVGLVVSIRVGSGLETLAARPSAAALAIGVRL